MAFEQHYAYAGGGSTLLAEGHPSAYLATSGGPAAHPQLFDGVLAGARRDARLLLAVGVLAGTRFFDPGVQARIRAADPVVTSDGDRLRFESFSACNGVAARVDLEGLV